MLFTRVSLGEPAPSLVMTVSMTPPGLSSKLLTTMITLTPAAAAAPPAFSSAGRLVKFVLTPVRAPLALKPTKVVPTCVRAFQR
jgi:hypothetical protein